MEAIAPLAAALLLSAACAPLVPSGNGDAAYEFRVDQIDPQGRILHRSRLACPSRGLCEGPVTLTLGSQPRTLNARFSLPADGRSLCGVFEIRGMALAGATLDALRLALDDEGKAQEVKGLYLATVDLPVTGDGCGDPATGPAPGKAAGPFAVAVLSLRPLVRGGP